MTLTDPIADMMSIIKNGSMAKKETVEVKNSKLHEAIMNKLKQERFIANYKIINDTKQGLIRVYLKYNKDSSPAITGIKRISKPGRRIYVKHDEIKSIYGGLGITLISTSKGIMTDKEAKESRLGGELLCHIW